jgi:hypothetical protein
MVPEETSADFVQIHKTELAVAVFLPLIKPVGFQVQQLFCE